ncbi:DegT/DnrJ/EryC1/StrS family aminotransferase [Photobacterium damselae]|uniref:DegT/DnrJ/EryC1/StrS family aminotransferase n=1 Tax=Photobacterium damselae TaxID=38293 RepID=UPI001EFDCCE3|nr:aminotransferase class V-fold PLP-dependent enzyme [Photobacterium damselae]MCG9780671.1 aminotransferase class V-fold PLP-dependent enzyme [Photobacterium damselae]
MIQEFKHPNIDLDLITDLSNINVIEQLSTYSGGELYKDVEKLFSEDLDDSYCLTKNSGTTALYTAYKSLGLKSGDEVLVPCYNFFAAVTPLKLIGCDIKFVDADEFGNMSTADLKNKISDRTKLISITHMWGIPANLTEIKEIADKYGAKIVEDCSHAHGAKHKGKSVGTFGDINAWSLGAKKIITGGQGGIIATKNKILYEKSLLLGHCNYRAKKEIESEELKKYAVTGDGLNLRMHPYAAMLIKKQLELRKYTYECRKKCVELMSSRMKDIDGINIIEPIKGDEASGYAFVFSLNIGLDPEGKDAFVKNAKSLGAFSIDIPNTTRPITDYPLFNETLNVGDEVHCLKEQFPNAYNFHNSIIKMDCWYGDNWKEICEQHIDAVYKSLK